MHSIFTERRKPPVDSDLQKSLKYTYDLWQMLADYVRSKCPSSVSEWGFTQLRGWTFRIKDRKRPILYFIPQNSLFGVELVLGTAAMAAVMQSHASHAVKVILAAAKALTNGRKIQLEVRDGDILCDIKQLVNAKLTETTTLS